MIFGTKNKKAYEHFSVTDGNNTLVSGIATTAFTVDLFNQNGQEVSSQIDVDVTELSSGHYRVEFIPDEVGTWYITVYHNDYFPWGKSDDVLVYTSDFDIITSDLARILGLTQENYYLDSLVYTTHSGIKLLTNSRIRIYSSADSVASNNDVIATYQITATWSGDALQDYKVEKV